MTAIICMWCFASMYVSAPQSCLVRVKPEEGVTYLVHQNVDPVSDSRASASTSPTDFSFQDLVLKDITKVPWDSLPL